jgi:cytidylate kinase
VTDNRSPRERPIVAIDGPAGAGKSTVARRLADELGYVLVDTGAMYRVVALAASRALVPWSDGPALGALADKLVQSASISFARHPTRGLRVVLSGEDVSEAIRTPEMGMGASQVSAHAEVRAALLDLQRQAGRAGAVVLEGRDIGTVVFPEAEVKFYLTASPQVRARRRFEELIAKGEKVTYEQTLIEVERRDANDTGREHAPLRRADDALLVDSSNMSIDDTVRNLAERVRQRERGPG